MLRGMGTSSAALVMTPESGRELQRIVHCGKTEQRIALRARIVLGAAGGHSNNAVAKELKTSRPTLDWRRRFAAGVQRLIVYLWSCPFFSSDMMPAPSPEHQHDPQSVLPIVSTGPVLLPSPDDGVRIEQPIAGETGRR
jgi:hypothetical protein